MIYDIFISYRRDGGFETADAIYQRLLIAGYRVFFDMEQLNSGKFNVTLYSRIQNCKDFIIVLPKQGLDRCHNDNDWVLLEIEHAIKCNKNIIPIMLKGFTWPSNLPDSIKELPNYNGIHISEHHFFFESIEKLKNKFLISRNNKGLKRKARYLLFLSILLLNLSMLIFFILNNKQTMFSNYFYNASKNDVIIKNLCNNMIFVKGGTFNMGATSEQNDDFYEDELPVHRISLDDFFIGKYEVTQKEWSYIMGGNPSTFKGDNLPVENISLYDCQEFILKLSKITGKRFSLPTEAQWEFVARGGEKSKFTKYSGSQIIDEVGWYWKNSGERTLEGIWNSDTVIINQCCTHPVGMKKENELGIFDMNGNVWEWCSDLYGKYADKSETNPKGYGNENFNVIRGGSWYSDTRYVRTTSRRNNAPDYKSWNLGFRLVQEK